MTADDLHARADCARRNPVVLRDGKPVVTITCDHADALADLIDAAREVERLAALRGFRGGALADALAALEADQIVTGGEESGAVTPSAPASFPAPDPSGDTDPATEALRAERDALAAALEDIAGMRLAPSGLWLADAECASENKRCHHRYPDDPDEWCPVCVAEVAWCAWKMGVLA